MNGQRLGPGQDRRVIPVDLGGVNAKIERAREGLRSLEADISAYCEYQRRRVIFDYSQPKEHFLGSHSNVPISYSIRIGEIAYNLRSALDHLIWQLVQANGKKPTYYNEFPIVGSESEFEKRVNRNLKWVDEEKLKLIHDFQPFSDVGEVGKNLFMLNKICNIDKHRHLNVLAIHSHVHLDKSPLDPLVDVCFMDKELEENSPGYNSPIEHEGIRRPPVVSTLSSCLVAVNFVVGQLTGQVDDLIFERVL